MAVDGRTCHVFQTLKEYWNIFRIFLKTSSFLAMGISCTLDHFSNFDDDDDDGPRFIEINLHVDRLN